MYPTKIKRAFIYNLRQRLSDFNIADKDFFDPNMDFQENLHPYTVAEDIREITKRNVTNKKSFIAIVWNRDEIQEANRLARNNKRAVIKNLNDFYADIYLYKHRMLRFNIAFISDDPFYLEQFESAYNMKYDITDIIKDAFNLPNCEIPHFTELGIKCDIKLMNNVLQAPIKMPKNEFGTLTQMNLSFTAYFYMIEIKEPEFPLVQDFTFEVHFDTSL